MFLAIDIGNTNVTLGVFDGEKLRCTWRLETDVHKMPDEYATTIIALLNLQKIPVSDIKEVALCSTVAPLIPIFVELVSNYFKVKPLIVTVGVKTGVRIHGDNPREVGADRIVNTVAGYKLYGGPTIVVDLGTATTLTSFPEKAILLVGLSRPVQ